MSQKKSNWLTYQNVEEALAELNAKDKGRYFLCTCPECEEPEAFIYKNNVNFIQCNRESECGERMMLQYREKEDVRTSVKEEGYPKLSREQAKSLEMVTRFTKYMQYNVVSETLDEGFRGLSREATEPFVADLIDPVNVKKLFGHGKGLFPKDYSNSDWMAKRNLAFPIYGDNGMIERVLLRSTIDPSIEPKEIQLIVNPSKDTRDFFIDIPKEADTVVFSEAILDGLSFREIDKDVGIMALTGAAKSRGMSKFIVDKKELFQDKNIIVSMDDDKAGWRATRNIVGSLEEIDADYQLFLNADGIKDTNQFLNEDEKGFRGYYDQLKGSFEFDRRGFVEIKDQSQVVVLCDTRLDAISFRCVDSDVGVIALEDKEEMIDVCSRLLGNEEVVKGKKVVLAMSGDENGQKRMSEVQKVLGRLGVDCEVFPFPKGVKSANEFLEKRQKDFEGVYESIKLEPVKSIGKIEGVRRDMKLGYER